jgi:hypothetical protein
MRGCEVGVKEARYAAVLCMVRTPILPLTPGCEAYACLLGGANEAVIRMLISIGKSVAPPLIFEVYGDDANLIVRTLLLLLHLNLHHQSFFVTSVT